MDPFATLANLDEAMQCFRGETRALNPDRETALDHLADAKMQIEYLHQWIETGGFIPVIPEPTGASE